jgi:hypothetical protein
MLYWLSKPLYSQITYPLRIINIKNFELLKMKDYKNFTIKYHVTFKKLSPQFVE